MPRPQELVQARRQVGAPEPVGDLLPRHRHRGRSRVVRQGGGQAGQRGREREGLRPPGPREGPHQLQVRRRVALHRLAHVAEERHGQGPVHGTVALELHRLPARTPGRGDRLAQRHSPRVGADALPAAAAGGPPGRGLLEPAAEQLELGLVELVEGRVGDPLHRTRQQLGKQAIARLRPRLPSTCVAGCATAARRLRPPPRRRRRPGTACPRLPPTYHGPGRRACRSTGSAASAKTASKTASNRARSCWRPTRVIRASQ